MMAGFFVVGFVRSLQWNLMKIGFVNGSGEKDQSKKEIPYKKLGSAKQNQKTKFANERHGVGMDRYLKNLFIVSFNIENLGNPKSEK
jgi:hypothetical protein